MQSERGWRGLLQRFAQRADAFWYWFFPPQVVLGPRLEQFLAEIFPDIDWQRVSFHRGKPHVLSWIPFGGITLPATFRLGMTRIFIRRDLWKPELPNGLGLVLHESFHAQQAQEAGVGRNWGLGLFHPFIALYLACAAGCWFRYRDHPMEIDAYRFAGEPKSRFELQASGRGRLTAELAAQAEPFSPQQVAVMGRLCAGLVCREGQLGFWAKLAHSTPGFHRFERLLRRGASWRKRIESDGLRFVTGSLLLLLIVPFVVLATAAVVLWSLFWILAAAVLAAVAALVEGLGLLVAGSLRLFARGLLWSS